MFSIHTARHQTTRRSSRSVWVNWIGNSLRESEHIRKQLSGSHRRDATRVSCRAVWIDKQQRTMSSVLESKGAKLAIRPLSGCKARQYAVAETNQNRLDGDPSSPWRMHGSSLNSLSAFAQAEGPTAFWLVAATANWISPQPLSSDEMGSVEMR